MDPTGKSTAVDAEVELYIYINYEITIIIATRLPTRVESQN